MRVTLSLLATVLLGAMPAAAVTPYLVKDINPLPASQGSVPQAFVTVGGLAFFTANDSLSGRELWRTDRTAAGTFQVVDACPGECSGSPRFVAQNGRSYFFLASSEEAGEELWVTGGLPANTFRLTDALRFPSVNEGIWSAWVASQGVLYFAADDGIHGRELWRTDGTRAGTFQVADVRLGPDGSNPGDLTDFNGRLFFRADDGRVGASLWKSDGTAAGTQLVRDPVPASAGNFGPVHLRVVNRTLFFVALVNSRGSELWKSDGTARGTVPLTNIRFSPTAPFLDFAVLGSRLLFIAADPARGQELWASDGTAAGTRALTNLKRADAFFLASGTLDKLRLPQLPTGNRLVFRADDGLHGIELWSTDGTPKGTSLLRDVCPGTCNGAASDLAVTGGRAFFTGYDGTHTFEPWVTDGTAAGTRLIVDLCPGLCQSYPAKWNAGAGKAFFVRTEENGKFHLWRTDGTASGTVRLTSFSSGGVYLPPGFQGVFLRGAFLFDAVDRDHGQEPWTSDGTPQGTRLVADVNTLNLGGSAPHDLHAAGGKVYFLAYDGNGSGLWASDGTEAGTTLVLNAEATAEHPFPNPRISAAVEAGGRLFFVAAFAVEYDGSGDFALWRTDGTPGGTVRLTPEGIYLSPYDSMAALGNQVFFTATDGVHGYGLWVTDGTAAGTRLAVDLQSENSGSSQTGPREFAVFQGRLYFIAALPEAGFAIWRSDGTAAGTAVVKTIGAETRFTEHAGRLWFVVTTFGEQGQQIWSSDGTPAGTGPANLYPGSPDFFAYQLVSAGSRLFFWGGSAATGQGLWVSDGTAAGTKRIGDALIANPSGAAAPVTRDGRLYFSGLGSQPYSVLWKSDGTAEGTGSALDQNGQEIRNPFFFQSFAGRLLFTTYQGALYQSDGTQAGTFKLLDLRAPSESGAFFELTAAGPRLFFRKWDRGHGSELWAVAAE